MFKFLVPTILIIISVGVFLNFTAPTYQELTDLRAQAVSLDEALSNSKDLEKERDKLTQKYNSINPENLAKIQKLLPDNVDNIRLILEIEKIAAPYGMALRDVTYDTENKKDAGPEVVQGGSEFVREANKDYGVLSLGFSTQSTYNGLIAFLKDLETNLRIVDVISVSFTSDVGAEPKPGFDEVYKYNIKIKTYWLKN